MLNGIDRFVLVSINMTNQMAESGLVLLVHMFYMHAILQDFDVEYFAGKEILWDLDNTYMICKK